nr:hypothetical protein [Tanacetum cinerariifolium]
MESNSPEFDQISDIEEQSEEEVRETMRERMEQYMSKTRGDYRLGVTRPTINQDTQFELKGQFLKELRDNTFSGVIPSKTAADAKVAIQEMDEFSQKWHNGTSSRSKSTETSDGLAVIQAQLNNLEREIKKVNEKVYAAQVAFCLKTRCVLFQDSLRFVTRLVAFCLKTRCVLFQDSLRFVTRLVAFFSRLVAFCHKTRCVLSQDSLRFVSRLVVFCLKTRCVLSQDSLRFVSRLAAFCLRTLSTQQDIYTAGFKNRPPMLNKDNYVPWSSRIIRYARSRPNGKMIVDFIENGPYVRRMIATPGEPDFTVLVPESFHEQTDEELTENDIKRMDADD